MDRSAASTAPLKTLMAEDFVTHYSDIASPGLHALCVYRVGHWGLSQPPAVRFLVKVVHRVLNKLVIRNLYGVEIADEAFIGRRVAIAHHVGVQIPGFCTIGDDTVVRHNVTIGFTGNGRVRQDVPQIGRRVSIGAGASLLGPITIGDDATIGPHAVVTVDVPAGATAFSQPARIMKSPTPRTRGTSADPPGSVAPE